MVLSENEKREYMKRLLLSRMRILCDHGFYGLLLMHMRYGLDESVETACTDGKFIIFAPSFLKELSDKELDFVMMHEIMHVVLQHCTRGDGLDKERYNIACDIVVNSNILLENNMQLSSITLHKYGVAKHTTPTGKEGYEYTAEQVYDLVSFAGNKANDMGDKDIFVNAYNGAGGKCSKKDSDHESQCGWDNHTHWGKHKENARLKEEWNKWVRDAAEAISIKEASTGTGDLPLFAKRLLEKLKKPKLDWRTLLQNFIQQEICDYSFCPPDRRYDDNPFYLPDFNEKEDVVGNVLFMVDTSGSISDEMVALAYSEIKGAIEQFNGMLKGWIGFFDAEVTAPVPFMDEDELLRVKPVGGGGTSFYPVFEYVKEKMQDNLPETIVILTDGCATFPPEKMAEDIPVLWLINNEHRTPPWGKVARIEV